MSPRRAIVVGGSIAGLAAAILLRKTGWQVEVFERTSSDQGTRGAGIVTHPQLFAALAAIGVPAAAIGDVQIASRKMLDRLGRVTIEIGFPQSGATWASVFAALQECYGAAAYHPGMGLESCEEADDGVVARFADGSSAAADLLVGADGMRSVVRRHVAPLVAPAYAGYVTWRGVVPAGSVSRATVEMLYREFCFCLPEGEQIAGYPIPHGRSAEGIAYNYVWYRPADRESLKALSTDSTGRHHPLGIPPPLVRASHIESMRRDAVDRLSPQFSDLIAATEQPFFQAIYDLEVGTMVKGRVALVGDAAFVARPHVGAGVTKALEDAVALSRALSEEDSAPTALARFDAERRPVGSQIVAMARGLGAYMQAERRTEQERSDAARYRDPSAVLSDNASLRFLEPGSRELQGSQGKPS